MQKKNKVIGEKKTKNNLLRRRKCLHRKTLEDLQIAIDF
jgi:hypothetical protein